MDRDLRIKFEKGRFYLGKHNFKEARKWFNDILKEYPHNMEVNLQLFNMDVLEFNYEEAFNYLDVLLESRNNNIKSYANYYLFLLSYIVPLKEKYKLLLKNFLLDDITIKFSVEECKDIKSRNKIRRLSFMGHFSNAQKSLLASKEPSIGYEFITTVLLRRARAIQINWRNNIIKEIQDNNYEEVLRLIQNESQKRLITYNEYDVLSLLKEIVRIEGFNERPSIREEECFSYSDALRCHDYKKALELLENSISKHKNPAYLLLLKINELLENDNLIKKEYSLSFQEKLDNLLESLYPQLEKRRLSVKVSYRDKYLDSLEDIKNIIDPYIPEVEDKGVVIIDIPLHNITKTLSYVSDIPDLFAFQIDIDKPKIVLAKKTPKIRNKEFTLLQNDLKLAFKNGDYQTAIYTGRRILENTLLNDYKIYIMVGLAYYHLEEKELAITYLEIGKYLSMIKNIPFEYDVILNKLKGINKGANISNEDFINEALKGINLREVVLSKGYSEEYYLLLCLEYATYCLEDNNLTLANVFIKRVEQSKSKSKKVKDKLEEIRKNQKLYLAKQSGELKEIQLLLRRLKKKDI